LAAREEELKSSQETIEKLRSASKAIEATESEAVASLKSSHILEVSQHAEKIRNLEESLHASTSRVHDLSRQLGDLQDAYSALQKERDDAIAAPSTFSPRAVGSSTRGLFLSPAEEIPSSSSPSYFPDQRNGGPSRPFSVDSLLPASVRHKRQVSLTALKARMEHSHSYTRPPIDRMESVSETADKSRRGSTTSASNSTDTPGIASALGFVNSRRKARQQFGDEIVGCCPACEGDIISL
jgi:small-conductance mechanosensitive channel